MNQSRVAPFVLRSTAIIIALTAAIDPAITSNKSARPDIAVVAVDSQRDSALASTVARSLGSGFVVTTVPFANAAATVLVGDALPAMRSDIVPPVFAVTPDQRGRRVTIESVNAPASVPLEARVPVTAVVHATGAKNSDIVVTLRDFGVVVDRVTRRVNIDDQRTAIPLVFAPSDLASASLAVTAEIVTNGARTDSVHADLLLQVRDTLSVLFYEPRPSWQSTFVRRAAESDSRLSVTSRTTTSKNVSTSIGKAPAALDNAASLDQYSAIVVGAPDALNEREVSGLEAFMRQRGGSVVLLLDGPANGTWQRLAGAAKWLDNGSGRIARVAHDSSAPFLKSSELAWPEHLPPGAEPLALSFPARGDPTTQHPVIWSSPVGLGELTVSGALDSWRYRDSSVSAFDHVWRDLIVSAASRAVPPVAIALSNSIVAPNEVLDATVEIRDAMVHPLPAHAGLTATVKRSMDDAPPTSVRLWPDGAPGVFRGTFRAPSAPGLYWFDTNDLQAGAVFRVAAGTIHPHADSRDLLAAWVRSHGGRAIDAENLGTLPALLRAAIHAAPRPVRWHPMRSPWWIVPFALLLSAEWWWRRRNGRG